MKKKIEKIEKRIEVPNSILACDDLNQFIEELNEIRNNCIKQSLKNVKIDFYTEAGYENEIHIECDVYDYRLETDEELAERTKKEYQFEKERISRELAEYNRLKKKFEGK
jgi:hypothetical protein